MIITLSIPDEVYAKYAEQSPKSPQRAVVEKLTKHQDDWDPRALVLSMAQRQELERLLQRQLSGADVVELVKRLITVTVGEVDVPLSPGQLKRAEGEARFFKRPLKEIMEQKIRSGMTTAFGGV